MNEAYDRVPNFTYPPACEIAIEQAPRRIPDKAAKLLTAMERRTSFFGKPLKLTHTDYPLGYCQNADELGAFLDYCRDRKWLTFDGNGYDIDTYVLTVKLTADGFAELEARAKANVESEKVFVAMWFTKNTNGPQSPSIEMAANDTNGIDMDMVYEQAIKKAIEDDCGYRAIRIDMQEFTGDFKQTVLPDGLGRAPAAFAGRWWWS